MLELKNIYKTFNPGTINEKVALNGLNLTLNEGDYVTVTQYYENWCYCICGNRVWT